MISVILLAGGRAFGPNEDPWCLAQAGSRRIIDYSNVVLDANIQIEHVVTALPKKYFKDDKPVFRKTCTGYPAATSKFESVLKGLRLCPSGTTKVIIHEADRPMINLTMLKDLLNASRESSAVVTVSRIDEDVLKFHEGNIKEVISRRDAFWVQTPQCYAYQKALEAWESMDIGKDEWRPSEHLDVWAALHGYEGVSAIPGGDSNGPICNKKSYEAFVNMVADDPTIETAPFEYVTCDHYAEVRP